VIDAEAGVLEVELAPEALEARRQAWQPREINFRSGAVWRYAQTVGSAEKGAVTHPGGAAEISCYADV
jgi:dihydroxy-acid dehydratase